MSGTNNFKPKGGKLEPGGTPKRGGTPSLQLPRKTKNSGGWLKKWITRLVVLGFLTAIGIYLDSIRVSPSRNTFHDALTAFDMSSAKVLRLRPSLHPRSCQVRRRSSRRRHARSHPTHRHKSHNRVPSNLSFPNPFLLHHPSPRSWS